MDCECTGSGEGREGGGFKIVKSQTRAYRGETNKARYGNWPVINNRE